MNLKPYKLWFKTLNVPVFDPDHAVYPEDETLSSQLSFAREADGFDEWWEWVREDFEVLEHYGVRVIESQEEAKEWSSIWNADLADLNEVVLLVELDAPRTAVLKKIEKLLNKMKRHKPGKVHAPLAAIPLFRKPNVAIIERLLRVYELKAAGKKLWEIAAIEKLCKNEDGTFLTGKNNVEDHIIMQITASREVRKAIDLVTNAHLGVFPKY